MLVENLINVSSKIKPGAYVSAMWQSIKQKGEDTYKKVSEGTIRLAKYENIASANPQGKVNPNETYIAPFIKYNSNTQRYSIMVATTNNEHHKPKVKYYKNDIEITKEEYQEVFKPRPLNSPVFTILVENVLKFNGAE